MIASGMLCYALSQVAKLLKVSNHGVLDPDMLGIIRCSVAK